MDWKDATAPTLDDIEILAREAFAGLPAEFRAKCEGVVIHVEDTATDDVLDTMGIQIKEQLRSLDDDARVISYSVVESPMGNLESHLATISVAPEGDGAHLIWTVEVVPDELLAVFQGVYESSVIAVKKQLES